MATRDFATHHMRVLSLAIASSVGESIVQHARAVKSDSGRATPPPATFGDCMRSPAHPPQPALEDDPRAAASTGVCGCEISHFGGLDRGMRCVCEGECGSVG